MNPLVLLNNVPETRPLIDMDLQMFLDMLPNLLNFIALAVLMTWLLYKPVQRILKARADRVEGDIKDAELSKLSAAELKEKYEKMVKEIDTERAAILEEARKSAREQSTQIVNEAKSEALEIKERANRDVTNELAQIKGAVHQSIIEISTDMAAKLIAATVDKSAHDRLFNEALAELEATHAFSTN